MKEKKSIYRTDCPVSTALDIYGDKWSLLIIRDMIFKGKNTYGDFLDSKENIATNILADRLALLEREGIISRAKHPDSKAKILYQLTDKGIDLIPVLIEIITWGEKYYDVHMPFKKLDKKLEKDKEGVIKKLYKRLRK